MEQRGCWDSCCSSERHCISFKGTQLALRATKVPKMCLLVFKAFWGILQFCLRTFLSVKMPSVPMCKKGPETLWISFIWAALPVMLITQFNSLGIKTLSLGPGSAAFSVTIPLLIIFYVFQMLQPGWQSNTFQEHLIKLSVFHIWDLQFWWHLLVASKGAKRWDGLTGKLGKWGHPAFIYKLTLH